MHRYFWFLILLSACTSQPKDATSSLFVLHAPERTGISFANTLFPSPDLNIVTFEYFNNGAGVAAGDVNGDGLTDLLFTGNMIPSRLYLNEGDFRFRDVTAAAGITTEGRWATGATMVDLNGDGWLDIYVSCAGPGEAKERANQLYINRGDGTFSEQAAAYGLADTGHTTQTVFFDYDRDGDLDAYLLTNIMDPRIGPNVIRPKRNNGQATSTDRLYRNDGGHFVDVSRGAGILKEGYGLGLAVTDIDQDGWLDIYITNDYLSNDLLYHNQGDGTFRDIAAEVFRHTSYSAMGNDVSDLNNDGLPDIVAVDMLPPDNLRRKRMIGSINYDRFRSELLSGYYPQYMRNTLQANQGKGPDGLPVFAEIGQFAGISATDWSWSCLSGDMDNDGRKDILITNGYPKDVTNMDFAAYKMNTLLSGNYNSDMRQNLFDALKNLDGAYLPNFAFRNQGDWTFADVSATWGFVQPSYAHGAVLADLDHDGDLDYVVNNTDAPAFIYENTGTGRHFFRLKAEKKINPALWIGAKVQLFYAGGIQYQEFSPVRGYQSCVEPVLHFGLDTVSLVDSVIITWMDGRTQTLREIGADQIGEVSYAPDGKNKEEQVPEPTPLFEEESEVRGLEFYHKEPHYADFKVQPLLTQAYSQLGPALAAGDFNGDGWEDVYVSGAFGQNGRLFIQDGRGGFYADSLYGADPLQEETAACWLDADGDGQMDLYVGSGGSEFPEGSPYYQDRLYLNRGGKLVLDLGALPDLRLSTGCVTAGDFDGDGDLDLFVGSRISPQQYAEIPRSVLLENQNGIFRDVSERFLPLGGQLGRISSAHWVDYDGDGLLDLALAGEWMPLTILLNKEAYFDPYPIPGTLGWWNSLAIADPDNDGDPDLLAGNLGRNHPYGNDTAALPELHTWAADGQQHSLISFSLQGKSVPLAYRDDLLKQFFLLKKTFTDYTSYGVAELPVILKALSADAVTTLAVETFSSGWLENRKDAPAIFHPWPTEAQWAPVQGIATADWMGDGRSGILLSGNNFAAETSSGRYDAFSGLLLTQKNGLTYTARNFVQTGFFLPGDARKLVAIELAPAGQKAVIAGRNNDRVLVFVVQNPN